MKKKKSTLLIVSMSFLLSIGTLMFSSCADKDDPSPILPTPEDTSYILKLKFSEKVEFKEILNKNDIQDLTETETAYFGERIQRSCPHELQFDRDSLSIVKTNNIVEKYKLKWQDKKLFIYQKPIDINPAKRKAMAVKNEKRFLKQKRNALKNPGYSHHPVKTQASFKRLLKAV